MVGGGCEQLLTIGEALALVLERVEPLEAEDVRARRRPAAGSSPSRPARGSTCRRFRPRRWTASRFAPGDAPATLPVVGRIAAGRPGGSARSRPGQAMAIATGGVVPDGADAVVPIEEVEERDGVVVVPGGVRRARTCAPAAATSARAISSSPPASGSAPRTWARSPRPG